MSCLHFFLFRHSLLIFPVHDGVHWLLGGTGRWVHCQHNGRIFHLFIKCEHMCVCVCFGVCVFSFLIVNPCFGIRFITFSTIKSQVVPAVPAGTPCSVLIFKASNFLIHIYIFKAKIVQLFLFVCFFPFYSFNVFLWSL